MLTAALLIAQACTPPLNSFDVHRLPLDDGWLHSTGGVARENHTIELDYYDNRRIDQNEFVSQGHAILCNTHSDNTRTVRYRHEVPIRPGTYDISQHSLDYDVCATGGKVIFMCAVPIPPGQSVTVEWDYTVLIAPSGDFNGDGVVDEQDLGPLFVGWGVGGETDLNGDGTTDALDLSILLANWG